MPRRSPAGFSGAGFFRDTIGEDFRELSSRLSGGLGGFSTTCGASEVVLLRNMLVNFPDVDFNSGDAVSLMIEGAGFDVCDVDGELMCAPLNLRVSSPSY